MLFMSLITDLPLTPLCRSYILVMTERQLKSIDCWLGDIVAFCKYMYKHTSLVWGWGKQFDERCGNYNLLLILIIFITYLLTIPFYFPNNYQLGRDFLKNDYLLTSGSKSIHFLSSKFAQPEVDHRNLENVQISLILAYILNKVGKLWIETDWRQ